MPKAVKGVLVECDPSIKSIIMKLDADAHQFVVEELDDEHVLVKEHALPLLKEKLDAMLAETVVQPEMSGSDKD